MSRSNNVDTPNPANRFYRWDGAKGGFSYYDKSLGEKGENVKVPLPFRFMVLDCLSTIKGYSDAEQSGFWSNEVRDIKKDILTVKTKKGQVAKGTYTEVKAALAGKGAKFCQSVYIADKIDGKLAISNVQLTGAALSSWIEFRKKDKQIYDGVIDISEMQEGKKGITVYQIPVFKKIPSNPSADAQAVRLDKQVQEYLKSYMVRTQDEIATIHAAEIQESPTDSDLQDAPNPEDYSDIPDEDLPF